MEEAQGVPSDKHRLSEPTTQADAEPPTLRMVTRQVLRGLEEKIRIGNVLGALIDERGLTGAQAGNFDVKHVSAFLTVARELDDQARHGHIVGEIDGRSAPVRRLRVHFRWALRRHCWVRRLNGRPQCHAYSGRGHVAALASPDPPRQNTCRLDRTRPFLTSRS